MNKITVVDRSEPIEVDIKSERGHSRPYRTVEMLEDYAKLKGISSGEAVLKLTYMNREEKLLASEEVDAYRRRVGK